MKKIALFLTIALVAISCKNKEDYTITGSVAGMQTGTIFLEKQLENGMGVAAIDTVKVVDGKFEIVGKALEPNIHFIQVENVQGKVPFILEAGDISITIDKDSIFKSKMGGTYNNDEFYTFNEELGKIQKKSQGKVIKFQQDNLEKMNEAKKNNDTAAVNAVMKEFKALKAESNSYMNDYPKTHPKSFISLLLVESMLNNPEIKIVDSEKIFNSLDENLKKSTTGKKILESIATLKKQEAEVTAPVQSGSSTMAPNFEGKSPDGKIISLKESMGKVTIIDFWASWCQPCRVENPSVVAMYNELHSKGLNIIGVSLDENVEKWKKAIADDKITWNQVSNLKGWKDPIAVQYNITQIPATIILDASGKVVAKDLRGAALKAKVEELLAK